MTVPAAPWEETHGRNKPAVVCERCGDADGLILDLVTDSFKCAARDICIRRAVERNTDWGKRYRRVNGQR